MGRHDLPSQFSEDELRAFMKAILADVHALERMLDEERFETGIRRIGAEQEMFLLDRSGRAWNGADAMMKALSHPQFTFELAQFNLEANLQPQVFGGKCLSIMEEELRGLLSLARKTAADQGGGIVLSGILPTLRRSDLSLDSMVQNPRYLALNNAMAQLRGGEFQFRIKGVDELEMTHDNVMLESCNTSFQVHFQVAPSEFAKLYNVAQAITAPVLAASTNSPILLGRRLWRETRVALFQQSVDARSAAHQLRGRRPRVDFGDAWVRDSVLEIFREDIARFRVVLASDIDEDPDAVLDRGGVPELTALRLHNGTVYRWNRACYGVERRHRRTCASRRAHPARGPDAVIDEMANGGLLLRPDGRPRRRSSTRHPRGDVASTTVKEQLHRRRPPGIAGAVQLDGQEPRIHGPGPDPRGADLLPTARAGLKSSHGLDDRRHRPLPGRARVSACRSGTHRLAAGCSTRSAAMGDEGTKEQRMNALVRALTKCDPGAARSRARPSTRGRSADAGRGGRRLEGTATAAGRPVHDDRPVHRPARRPRWTSRRVVMDWKPHPSRAGRGQQGPPRRRS